MSQPDTFDIGLCGEAVTPNPDVLLQRMSDAIDDEMLSEIAARDRGRERGANYRALLAIRTAALNGAPFDVDAFAQAHEVLGLVRWSNPDDLTEYPGEHRLRAHWMRAYCCTVLLRASCCPELRNALEGQNQTLIQLLHSLDALPRPFHAEAAALLESLVATAAEPNDDGDPDEYLPFCGLGLLWLILKSDADVPDAALENLCAWISEHEKKNNDAHYADYGRAPGPWLLSTTYFNLCNDAWRALGTKMRQLDMRRRSIALQDWVRTIGELLK
jgi:hypothetical protein